MKFKNSENNYGLVAIIFHWGMAIIVISMIVLGIYMVRLPVSIEKLKLYGWHKQIGVLILGLIIFRLIWRMLNVIPQLNDLPRWERIAARTVHWAFYGFLFALPLSGWIMSSAADLPVSFFGLFTLPDLVSPNKTLFHLFVEIHHWLAFALIATLILHILATIKHVFIDKDEILRRMLEP